MSPTPSSSASPSPSRSPAMGGYLSGRKPTGSRSVQRVERETTEKRTRRIVERQQPNPPAPRSQALERPAEPPQQQRQRRVVPDVPVPLPEPIGKATEDTRNLIDDTVGNLTGAR